MPCPFMCSCSGIWPRPLAGSSQSARNHQATRRKHPGGVAGHGPRGLLIARTWSLTTANRAISAKQECVSSSRRIASSQPPIERSAAHQCATAGSLCCQPDCANQIASVHYRNNTTVLAWLNGRDDTIVLVHIGKSSFAEDAVGTAFFRYDTGAGRSVGMPGVIDIGVRDECAGSVGVTGRRWTIRGFCGPTPTPGYLCQVRPDHPDRPLERGLAMLNTFTRLR
jgi:hypothetical protein